MRRPPARRVLLGTVVAVSLLRGVNVAGAAGSENPPATPRQETPAPAGVRVYVDPATGRILSAPTLEQIRRLDRAVLEQRAAEQALQERSTPVPLVPFPLAGGGEGVRLDDRFLSSTVVRRDASGQLELRCFDQVGAAVSWLDEGALPETLNDQDADGADR